ncbi:glycosyltransferase [Sphingomonas sp. Tas61C01]|uniref:glycosyltransferase n=1 Tax=Sphingomonas sp. Tas61C01 TaxID=3458297 RepID=UPI00403E5DA4
MPAGHILTYAQSLADGGGVERAMLRLASGWIKAGRRVTLVLGDRGAGAPPLPDGLATIELGSAAYRALTKLPAIVRAERPDVVFCPGNHYTLVAAWIGLRLGRAAPPIVAKMSNAPDRADLGAAGAYANRLWLARHHRFLDHLVAMTPATAAAAARAMGMIGRTSVIANPPVATLAAMAGAPLVEGRWVLGVGRLVPQKRWDRLIAAMPSLPADVSLAIFGEGDLRPVLERQIATSGMVGRVILPGHAANPLPAMRQAAVVALTSDYEGVPGVLREALSVGTPVVATDSSVSISEIVAAPTLGSIVPRDDPQALAAALLHWLDAPRPAPVPPPGADAAARYLDLFDRLV